MTGFFLDSTYLLMTICCCQGTARKGDKPKFGAQSLTNRVSSYNDALDALLTKTQKRRARASARRGVNVARH